LLSFTYYPFLCPGGFTGFVLVVFPLIDFRAFENLEVLLFLAIFIYALVDLQILFL